MASETELRLYRVSRHAIGGLRGRLRAALVFLELLKMVLRRFGVSMQHVASPTASPAHGPDALSLASVDAGDELRGSTGTTDTAGRTTAPKRRTASLNFDLRLKVEPTNVGAG